MLQYRRLAALVLGMWLGAGVFADLAVTQNFQTIDRFLGEPGSIRTAVELNAIGRGRERTILRRNAGEENDFLFEAWEWAQLALGLILMSLLLFGGRPQPLTLTAGAAMLLIVMAQRFFLSPEVSDLGRRIADLPSNDPLNAKFWLYHGIYSGVEILKLLIGIVFAARLAVSRKPDPNRFAKDFAHG